MFLPFRQVVDERAVFGAQSERQVGREVLATNASRRCPRLLVFSEVLFRLSYRPAKPIKKPGVRL